MQYYYYRQGGGPFGRGFMNRMLTPAVKALIIANCVVFLAQILLRNEALEAQFALSVDGIRHFKIWQLFTYMFMHAHTLWHILLNMLMLFFLGPETERTLGTRRFSILYLVSGVLGGLGWVLISGGSGGMCVGASGAVFGILGAFAALYPERPITLLLFFVLPVTMKVKTLALGLGAIQLVSLLLQPDGIAYAAHLAGGVAGYLYALALVKSEFGKERLSPGGIFKDIMWRWQRRKFKVMNGSGKAPPPPSGFSGTPDQQEVDRILDKISKWGIHTITREEHEILKRASRR